MGLISRRRDANGVDVERSALFTMQRRSAWATLSVLQAG